MSSFSGFSDADIHKLRNGEPINNTPNTHKDKLPFTKSNINNIKKMKQQQVNNKQEVRKKQVLENKINSNSNPNGQLINDLPNEAKLVIPISSSTSPINATSTPINDNEKAEIKKERDTLKSETPVPVSEKKCMDLDGSKNRQKLMEEQNRQRKQQIVQALEDRTKRTQQEQQKLVEIQNEFKKLDASLSTDVKILRQQIELASYDYMEAHKKYHRIEKEFLAAKLFLHRQLEKKEMLTEHLSTIIEKNEERKADKLNELLLKLKVLDNSEKVNDTENVIAEKNEVTSTSNNNN